MPILMIGWTLASMQMTCMLWGVGALACGWPLDFI